MKIRILFRIEQGFTITEAVVAVMILSISTGLLLFGIQKFMSFSEKVSLKNSEHIELLLCRKQLQTEIMKIKRPFWDREESGADSKKSFSRLSLPYYLGIKDSILEVGFSEEGFYIHTSDDEKFYPALRDGYITRVSRDNIEAGLTVTFSTTSGQEYTVFTPYGSFALGKSE